MNEHFRTMEELRAEALVCCRCDLCRPRTQVVFGEGPAPARLMIVGEGPGADEDGVGRPFVGRAGRLLDRLLADAGIRREDAWLTNVVRCRPSIPSPTGRRNRAPTRGEILACDLWMGQELRFVSPEIIICLGAIPARVLIGRGFDFASSRGRWLIGRGGIPTIATYHPAYVQRFRTVGGESTEARALADLRSAAERLRSTGH